MAAICGLLVLAFAVQVNAQYHGPIRFGRIGVEKNLSSSSTYCTYQDSQGFLWVGTEEGLNKWDGYTFESSKFDPSDPLSISSNIVRCIFEDSHQNLWIGTDNGLNTYLRANGKFKRFLNVPGDANSLSNNLVSSITEDKAGIVWFGTGKGLNSYDNSTNKFTTYRSNPADPGTIPSDVISALLVDKSGTLWIGTASNGLCAMDTRTHQCVRYSHQDNDPGSLSENEINTLTTVKNGDLWVGTLNSGIDVLKKNGHFTHYSTSNGLTNNSIFGVHEDNTGQIWIATFGGGLNVIDLVTGKIVVHKFDPQNKESLSSNKVWGIFEDMANTLWFSTSNGLSYYNRTIFKFTTYKINESAEESGNNSIFSIYEDKQGYTWCGVLGGGLNVFSRREGRFVNEKFASLSNPQLRFCDVFCIAEDPSGLLWIGTSTGLLCWDRKSGNIRQFKHDPADKNSISNDYIRSLFIEPSGAVWIGTHGGGLNVYNPKTGSFNVLQNNPSDPASLSNNVVMNIFQDKDGRLWISTYGGGLNRLDRATGKFTFFKNEVNNPKSISSNFIHCVYQDKNGVLWVGTYGGGLNTLNESDNSFTHYTERDGLPNNIVNGILSDIHGNIWVSTNNGACKMKPQSDHSALASNTRSYNEEAGLQNKLNENACFNGQDGWMYFGGNSGLNVFHPDSIRDNTVVPPVVITKFYLFEKPARMDTLITSKRSLDLNYKQNFFSFEFAALNFLFPEKNRYAYRMEGLDNDWIYRGSSHYAQYTNIDPGKYIFHVKACNNDGVWNDEGISIYITITPPFWRTWWFTGLSAFSIALIIFVYIRIRTNTLVKQNIVLEEKVNQRTHELQDKNIQLTNTMENLRSTQDQLIQSEKMASLGQLTAGIAHEIQNPLNFVNNFSEISVELLGELEEVPDKTEQKEIIGDLKQNLDKIVFHGKRADSIVKGMLQHSRASTAEKQPTDINKLVDEFFNLAYHGMRAKDPSFNCSMEKHLAKDLPPINIIPQDISRVILNIFNNSFYAVDERKRMEPKNYQPTVSITTLKENNKVIIRIRDNGKGIPQDIKDKIFNPFFTTKPTGQGTGLGLSISYDIIVKGHSGEISVDSKPGEFTEFVLAFPIST